MAEFNDDEVVAPEWLNSNFFFKVLSYGLKIESPKIHELFVAPASHKGDHYASIMFRVSILYAAGIIPTHTQPNQEYITMIVKTLPAVSTLKGKLLSESSIFENELHTYAKLIPSFEEEWQRCGENIKFAGKLLYYSLFTPQPVIVMEDLCAAGYDILRERLFNHNEVKQCLQKLAKWHAVSYKLAMLPDPNITQMQCGLFRNSGLVNSDYISDGTYAMIRALEVTGGFERFLPKLKLMAPQLIARCKAMNDAYANGLVGPIYVLNHGDFHTKNIMIKRTDSETLEDILFVDFQMCFFGPSTYDLTYASFTLLSKDLREQKRDELLNFYFVNFIESLKKLRVQQPWPNFADFQNERKRWSCFEMFLVSTFLPLAKLSDATESTVDINLIFNSMEYRRTFYMNANYMAYLKELLPRYLEMGYLE